MIEEPIHYLTADDGFDDVVDRCFENSQIYEDAAIDWVLTDGANEFMWSDSYERAYEKWLETGDEE